MFEQTVRRFADSAGAAECFEPPIILANVAHADLVEEAVGAAPYAALALEPVSRNTAAAAAIAAQLTLEIAPEALVLLAPADHLIADQSALIGVLANAAAYARERIVTFGAKPTRAETGYGYIQAGARLREGVFAIESFHEKPSPAVAQQYLDAGGYFWNSGMFLFDPRVLLREFDAAADIRDRALAALAGARRHGLRIMLDEEAFARVPAVSLDVAIMERTRQAAVAPCDIGWSDIGAWDEVWRLSEKDLNGNATEGKVAALDAGDCLLRAEGVTLCVAGVHDLIVIATPEAVIVAPRERAQEVKVLRELAAAAKSG